MSFRNIHVQAAQPLPAPKPTDAIAPKLRFVTNDPAREYAERPGTVERLSDAAAALILSKQGFSKVGRNGIRIDGLAAKPLTYWSENSVTIATKAGTNEKVLWTVNRQQPDVLHILTRDGEYVESIPLEGKVPWFDPAATAEILGAKKRANNRRIERVRDLHQPDTEAAIEAETINGAQIAGVVQTFPTRSRDGGRPQILRTNERTSATGADREALSANRKSAIGDRQFSSADRIHGIQRDLETRRVAHDARQERVAQRVAAIRSDRAHDDFTNGDADAIGAAVPTATRTRRRTASDWIL